MAKKVIPFGDRILVRRKKVGAMAGKEGLIHLPDQTADRPTDLAVVTYVPEHSFADTELLNGAEEIIKSMSDKAKAGDDEALVALLKFNSYLKLKSIQPGDEVMISKYVGTDFHDTQSGEMQTLVSLEDIIGLVTKE